MERAVSVYRLTEYIKNRLEKDENLQYVAVQGEISNFICHQSGHMYFSLKDDKSQVKAVMFRGANSKLTFKPTNGQKVIVLASISVYEPSGTYQLNVSKMERAGVGDLYQAFEELKQKLNAEGLFDRRYKKPIPAFPAKIGVITSANGAAVRDIRNVAGRRWGAVQLVLYPALVQGAGTEESLIKALRYFENDYPVDAVIIGRGGGSIEDLWGFNGEKLARTIFAMQTPVISAVGHETDFTICDFVADLRAPTPSAAAELAVPDVNTLRQRLDHLYQRVVDAGNDVVVNGKNELKRLSEIFGKSGLERYFRFKQECLKGAVAKIESLNPLAVLTRGYAVALKDGKAVTKSSQLQTGDVVDIRLSEGSATAKIQESVK